MSSSSNNFPRLLVLGIALTGLWLVFDKVGGGSGENQEGDANAPFADDSNSGLHNVLPTGSGAEEHVSKSSEVGDKEQPTQIPKADLGQELNEQNREAIRLLNEKRFAAAEVLFRKCHEAKPEEAAFASNLAECLVRRAIDEFDAKPEPSLEALIEAITLAPHRKDLLALRDRWTKIIEAQKGFAEDQSLHFVLQYDGARDELLSQGYLDVLQDLEAAYQDYGEFFDIWPVESGRDKFAVVLYDHEAFDHVTGIGEWAGGAYDGTIRVPVRNFQRDRARIRDVLRHELVHAFIEEVGGKKVPGWLNEGLAQYLSPEGGSARNLDVQAALRRMDGKQPLDFQTLTGTLAGLSDPKTIRMAYDQSLGLTHWIAYHYGERILVPMITDCKAGKTPAQAFQRQVNVALSAATGDFLDSL